MENFDQDPLNPSNSRLSANNTSENSSPRLLDQVRNVIRCRHYSIRTEQSYVDWIKRYILFHDKQHPSNLNETHITKFLNCNGATKIQTKSSRQGNTALPIIGFQELTKQPPCSLFLFHCQVLHVSQRILNFFSK